jgi:hypothetical protein
MFSFFLPIIPVARADDIYEKVTFAPTQASLDDVDRLELEANRQSGSHPQQAIGLYGDARKKLDEFYTNKPKDLNYWNRVKQLEGRKADLSWRIGDDAGKSTAESAVRTAEGEINKLEMGQETSSGVGSFISDIGEKLGQSGNTATVSANDAYLMGAEATDPATKDNYYQLAMERLEQEYPDVSTRNTAYYERQRDYLLARQAVQESLLNSNDAAVRNQAQNTLDAIKQDLEKVEERISSSSGGGFGGCLIATATYGSVMAGEVQFLREFRDGAIMQSYTGSRFLQGFHAWYYSFSPRVASYINDHPETKIPMRIGLAPLIGVLLSTKALYSSLAFSPDMAVITIIVAGAFLLGLVYFVLPATVVMVLSGKKGVSIPSVSVMKYIALGWAAVLAALVSGVILSSDSVTIVSSGLLVIVSIVLIAGFASLLLAGYILKKPLSASGWLHGKRGD